MTVTPSLQEIAMALRPSLAVVATAALLAAAATALPHAQGT